MRIIVQSSDDDVIQFEGNLGATIVNAGQRQGVTMPVDCLEGLCGTCKVELLSGDVDPGFYTDDAWSAD